MCVYMLCDGSCGGGFRGVGLGLGLRGDNV